MLRHLTNAPVVGLTVLLSCLSTLFLLPYYIQKLKTQVEADPLLVLSSAPHASDLPSNFKWSRMLLEVLPLGFLGTSVYEIAIKVFIFLFYVRSLERVWGSYYFFTVLVHAAVFALLVMHLLVVKPFSIPEDWLNNPTNVNSLTISPDLDASTSFYFYFYSSDYHKTDSTSQILRFMLFHNYNRQYIHLLSGGASLIVVSSFVFRYIMETPQNSKNSNVLKSVFSRSYFLLLLLLFSHESELYSTYNNNSVFFGKNRNNNMNKRGRGRSSLRIELTFLTRLFFVLCGYLFSLFTCNVNCFNNNNSHNSTLFRYFDWFTANISKKSVKFLLVEISVLSFFIRREKEGDTRFAKKLANPSSRPAAQPGQASLHPANTTVEGDTKCRGSAASARSGAHGGTGEARRKCGGGAGGTAMNSWSIERMRIIFGDCVFVCL
ncbi:hypothetical protein AGDE_14380 [Angomonas deanei]|uniref:Uncharacterized protein n=1 Tax=Angomonas deanei TaxID=59799 RepID=A0A7G2CLM6_9TRYP|nr:hypothetical protein AGDE_14380 [Angomonas deanei]CAD2219821.1 hypothetical protein, conserved [Angomonas deanei]|eukprot:EPY20947.1 hypothetical protein AGDE_14380 [Angomonas deanei]